MAHRHAEPIAIAKLLLQVELKAASPSAITASRIRQDQEFVGMREACSPLIFPPTGQSSDGKLWRIGGGPHIDRATIVADIIDPIGNGSQEGIVWKVMHIDRLCFLTPGSPSILEVANQLFLLGIHADDRRACRLKDLSLARNDLKLRRAIRVSGAGLALFRIHTQRVA